MTTLKPGSAEHQRLITASKIPAIMGISEWESPAQLWLRMNSLITQQETNEAMRRGHNQEASIREWYFTEMRPEYQMIAGETTLTRDDLPWAAATPDAIAQHPSGETMPVDFKSVARDMGKWGKPGTDQVPLAYDFQVTWQMHMSHGFLGECYNTAILVKHGPFVDQYDEYMVDYNPEKALFIEQCAKQFYDSLGDPDGCPPPSEVRGEAKAFMQLHPDIEPESDCQLDPELAMEFARIKEEAKTRALDEERIKAALSQAMRGNRIGKVGDTPVVRRQPSRGGVSIRLVENVTTEHIKQATTTL